MDITKCTGIGCDKRDKCNRFTAESGELQSWFANPPIDIETQECEMFWGCNAERIMNHLKDIVQGKHDDH